MPITTRAARRELIVVECVMLCLASVIVERMHLQTSTKVLLCVGFLLVAGVWGIIAYYRVVKHYIGWWPTPPDLGDKPSGDREK